MKQKTPPVVGTIDSQWLNLFFFFFFKSVTERRRQTCFFLHQFLSLSHSLTLSHTHTHPFMHARTHTWPSTGARRTHYWRIHVRRSDAFLTQQSYAHDRHSGRERISPGQKKNLRRLFFREKKNLAAVLLRETFRKKIRDFLLAFSFPMFVRDLLPRSNLIPAGNPGHPRMNKWLDANFVSQSQPNDWLIICLNE